MTTATTTQIQTCRRCGKPLVNNHGEAPYCMVHGEQSPEPVFNDKIKNKGAINGNPRQESAEKEPSKAPGNEKTGSAQTGKGLSTTASTVAQPTASSESDSSPAAADIRSAPDQPPVNSKHGGDIRERHQFIESHKPEIIRDLINLGEKKMLEKYHISATGWDYVKKRWGLEISKDGIVETHHSKPDKPKIKEAGEKHEFYLKNKEKMIQDLFVFGNDYTLQKWNINIHTLSHLKADPLYKQRLAAGKVKDSVPPPPHGEPLLQQGDVTRLPPILSFDANRLVELQLKWLQVYEKLIDKE